MKPHELLPDGQDGMQVDGQFVRKGSIGSFIQNVLLLDSQPSEADQAQAIADIKEVLPSLKILKVFEVFEVKSSGVKTILQDADPTLAL